MNARDLKLWMRESLDSMELLTYKLLSPSAAYPLSLSQNMLSGLQMREVNQKVCGIEGLILLTWYPYVSNHVCEEAVNQSQHA